MARSEPVQPSAWWFGLAAAIVVVGIVLAVVIVVRTAVGYFDRIDDFQRLDVPGSGTVALDDGDYTIYHEYPGANDDYRSDFSTPDVTVTLTAPDGSEVPLELYDTEVTYDTGDHEGEALYSFTAEEPGDYELTADGEGTDVAVGRGLGRGIVGSVVGALAVGLGSAVVGAVIAIVVAIARSRERQRRRIAFTRSQSGWPPAPGAGQPPQAPGAPYNPWQQPPYGGGPHQPQQPQQPPYGGGPQQPQQPQQAQAPGQPQAPAQSQTWAPPPPPPPPP